MCGILGVSSSATADETKIRWLFKENLSRGKDSSGLYSLKCDKTQTKTLYKNVAPADSFILQKGFSEAVKGAIALIGHTRAATVGTVCDANAHPFSYGEGEDMIVGVHNGFIIPQLLKKHTEDFGFDTPFAVDSEIIFAALSLKKGDYNVLSELEGAITIAWMQPNKHGSTIFLYRREPRTLNLGFSKDGVYFSSEALPLHYIGANSVWQMQKNSIVVLKDGKLLDLLTIKPPKINSLSLNCGRSSWEFGVPRAEYAELLPDFKQEKETKWEKYDLFDGVGFRKVDDNESDPGAIKKSFRNTNSEIDYISIIDEIRLELNLMDIKPVQYTEVSMIEAEDTNVCIVALRVVDDLNHQPLMGFTVIDEMVEGVDGITNARGLTLLKYEPMYCETAKQLIIFDPVDETKPFSVTITPKMGRIMEVVLTLPFRKGETFSKSTASDSVDGDHGHKDGFETASKSSLHILRDGEGEVCGIYSGGDGDALQKQQRQNGGAHTKEAVSGKGQASIPGYSLYLIEKIDNGEPHIPFSPHRDTFLKVLDRIQLSKVWPDSSDISDREHIKKLWAEISDCVTLLGIVKDANILLDYWSSEDLSVNAKRSDRFTGILFYAKFLLTNCFNRYMHKPGRISDLSKLNKFVSTYYNLKLNMTI